METLWQRPPTIWYDWPVADQESYETTRLRLRAYRESDAPRVLDIHSRYDVRRWIDDPPVTPMRDLAEAREWVHVWDALHAADPRLGAWAIVAKDTGVVAGTVLLASVPNSDGLVQIGWHLHPDSTGRGYVTEAAPVLLAEEALAASGSTARGIIVNAGCANAGTGGPADPPGPGRPRSRGA